VLDRDLEGLKNLLDQTYERKSAEVSFDREDINGTACNNSVGLGMTALHLAVREGLLEYVIAILSSSKEGHRVKVNMVDIRGYTALHIAAEVGNVGIARALFAAGARTNGDAEGGTITMEQPGGHIWPNKTGCTPLHLAVESYSIDMIQLLLEHSADMTRVNQEQLNPLDIAAEKNRLEAVVLFLERRSWNAEELGKALYRACRWGNLEICKELVRAGSNVEWHTTNNTTPLLIAAQEGNTQVVEFMLSVTANINAVRNDGASALYLAVLGKQPDVVRLLVASGADRTLTRNDGSTALSLAQKKGLEDIVALLS